MADINTLLKIMALLRDREHGCPWDIKQTFTTIAPHTLEEVYEVIDCIEQADFRHLPEELGDLLFQVVFYAQMGSEAGLFSFEDICESITNKLLIRHPHVFPDSTVESFGQQSRLTPEQVEANWEKIKQAEKLKLNENGAASVSLLNDVPQALPALLRARKLQGRAASGGFDWQDVGSVLAKVKEEVAELEEAMAANDQKHIEEEFGDLLFSVVNLSRHLKLNPESSLRQANNKFTQRFVLLEKMLKEQAQEMQELSLDELEAYWQRAKVELSE